MALLKLHLLYLLLLAASGIAAPVPSGNQNANAAANTLDRRVAVPDDLLDNFDPSSYLSQNPDVASYPEYGSSGGGLLHYLSYLDADSDGESKKLAKRNAQTYDDPRAAFNAEFEGALQAIGSGFIADPIDNQNDLDDTDNPDKLKARSRLLAKREAAPQDGSPASGSGADSFYDALQQLQDTYTQIENEAIALRILVAEESEQLAAARQSVQRLSKRSSSASPQDSAQTLANTYTYIDNQAAQLRNLVEIEGQILASLKVHIQRLSKRSAGPQDDAPADQYTGIADEQERPRNLFELAIGIENEFVASRNLADQGQGPAAKLGSVQRLSKQTTTPQTAE